MAYIFINPVVANMYIKEDLDEWLLNNGYVRVEIENDWHGIVKEKYNEALNSTEKTLIDKRCPLAVDTINKYEYDFTNLFKTMGFSANLNNSYKTISNSSMKISQLNFLELLEKKACYHKESPALWCTECMTTIAQAV